MHVFLETETTRRVRKLMANAANATMADTRTYIVEPGCNEPALSGTRCTFGWQTRGGRPIYYPSAYKRRGWSNMVYRPAEFYVVTCGLDWLTSQATNRAMKKELRPIRVALYRELPEAKAKRLERQARKADKSPTLRERLAAHKQRLSLKQIEILREAGFIVSTNGTGGKYFIGHRSHISYSYSGFDFHSTAYAMFDTVPSVEQAHARLAHVEVESLREREAWEAKEYAREAKKILEYELANTLPQGRVRFTNEGGFYIN